MSNYCDEEHQTAAVAYWRARPNVSEWLHTEEVWSTRRDRQTFTIIYRDTQPRIDEALRREFDVHAERWLRDTANSSSIRLTVMHPSYQRIIGMGKRALPLIFERLAASPDPWFWALRAITGEDPIDPHDAGRIAKMAEVWLAWARERKLTQ